MRADRDFVPLTYDHGRFVRCLGCGRSDRVSLQELANKAGAVIAIRARCHACGNNYTKRAS